MNTKGTSRDRSLNLQSAAILLLLLTALWAPSASEGGSVLDYLRYGFVGLFGSILIGSAYLRSARGAAPLVLPTGVSLLVPFLLYVVLSALWSEAWPSSVVKGGLVFLALLSTLAAATLKPAEHITKLIVIAAAVFTIIGCIVAIAIPSIGVETGWLLAGKWRGISGQKNGYAMQATVALVGTAILFWGKPRQDGRRAYFWPTLWIAFFAFCLLMAGSRGAQLMALVGLATAFFVQLSPALRTITVAALGLLLLPVLVAALMSLRTDATELGFLGLTFDTSSRTTIWAYGLEGLLGRELFGFGLGGFWTPERMAVFKDNHGWVLDNFHNGYVTILVENGIVGIGLLIASLVGIISALWRRTPSTSRTTIFAAAFVLMFISENFVENIVGRSTNYLFLSFMLVAFSALRLDSQRSHAFTNKAALTTG